MFTISDVAKRLNVSASTVRRLIDQGELAAVSVSPRCLRIEPAEIERFIAGRRADAPTAVTGAAMDSTFAAASAAFHRAAATGRVRSRKVRRSTTAVLSLVKRK